MNIMYHVGVWLKLFVCLKSLFCTQARQCRTAATVSSETGVQLPVPSLGRLKSYVRQIKLTLTREADSLNVGHTGSKSAKSENIPLNFFECSIEQNGQVKLWDSASFSQV